MGFHELRTWDPPTGGIYSFPSSRNGSKDAHSFEKAKKEIMRRVNSKGRKWPLRRRISRSGRTMLIGLSIAALGNEIQAGLRMKATARSLVVRFSVTASVRGLSAFSHHSIPPSQRDVVADVYREKTKRVSCCGKPRRPDVAVVYLPMSNALGSPVIVDVGQPGCGPLSRFGSICRQPCKRAAVLHLCPWPVRILQA